MKTLKCLAMASALLAGLLLAPLAKAQTASGDTATVNKLSKRLVGDYGYWSKYQTPSYSSAQIPYGMLTHINHAGVSLNPDGSLFVPPGFLEPALLRKAHKAGVKVLLLLGGDFPALEPAPGETATGLMDYAVGNLWTFITENGYDGIDIDWEYPATNEDRKTFFDLMTDLRGAFPRPTYTLSADVPPWGGAAYDLRGVEPLIDYYNIMMYDCAGPWTDDAQLNSPIFWDYHDPQPYECEPGGSAQQAIQIFADSSKVSRDKLNMGTPYYGYFYLNVHQLFGLCTNLDSPADTNDSCDWSVLTENYGTFIKQRIDQLGWRTYIDPIAMVPYMLRTDGEAGFITYDDVWSTYYRTWYSDWDQGLGGTFMWSLDADYDGHSQDLLDAEYAGSLNPN